MTRVPASAMRVLLAALVILGGAGPAAGQEGERRVLFTLDAQPSGPAVVLQGLERVVGPTPLLIPARLDGRYRLSVVEPGYESPRGDLVFRPQGSGLVLENYDRGLRRERALRSLLVPGLGQLHAGETARGWGYLAAAFGLGVATLAAEAEFLDAREDVRDLNVGAAGLPDEDPEARLLAQAAALDEQDEAYRLRNSLAGLTAAAWGLSVLDAALFVPEFDVHPMKADLLTIRVRRKTAAARAVRSAVLPGLGQFYGGSRLRGWVYLGAEAAAAGIALSSHLRYGAKNDEAETLVERVRFEERRGDTEGLERSKAAFRATLGDRDDAYDLRNQALAAAAAVWLVSVADALLLEERVPIKGGHADADTRGAEGVRLAWRLEPLAGRVGLAVRY